MARRGSRLAATSSQGVAAPASAGAGRSGTAWPGGGMAEGSGAGWPNRNPWPTVAPAATASRACLMVSMPSAMTTASVRSAWARTVLMMWAASAVVRPGAAACPA